MILIYNEKLQDREKVWVYNITSDIVIAQNYIPEGLHKMVCDCKYEDSGLIEYQVVRILFPSEYELVQKYGYFFIPIEETLPNS